ncbi:MAG: hypothetical protein OEM59_05370 [Rhodospirillales bacterium]|nr:hypothetical protein [Rhodospirillales bacterium]
MARSKTQKTTGTAGKPRAAFRFFDNREKYLMFVTTCSEKTAVAARVGRELPQVEPSGSALRVFDAGMGDGTVLCHLLRDLHSRFPHVPWLVVGKEVSMEDVRLTLEKLADRFHEHPEMVMVITNLYYSEAPWLYPNAPKAAAGFNWHVAALEGDTSHDFGEQLRALHPVLAQNWQVRSSEKTGNPLYVQPSVLVLYRKDREFILRPLLPKKGACDADFDLIIASQPYRSRMPVDFKVKNVLAPLTRALAPGGRMVTVQSYGQDPGLEIVRKIWPDANPFKTGRHELVQATKEYLGDSDHADLRYGGLGDEESLFRYHLHTMPSEIGSNIGTSTLLAAWNAAIYVAQIEDTRLHEALSDHNYLETTKAVLQERGGLWFNDESFVISRQRP